MIGLIQIIIIWSILVSATMIGGAFLSWSLGKHRLHQLAAPPVSLLIGLLIPSLFLAQLNYFLGIPVNQANLVAVWIVTALLTYVFKHLSKASLQFIKPKFYLLWLAALTAFIPIYFQWQDYTITGGDAPIYLYRMAYSINTGNLHDYFDRGIFYVLTVTFNLLAGLDLEDSLRLTHALGFTLSGLSVAGLSYSLTRSKWISLWVLLKTLTSIAYTSFVFDYFVANRLALTVSTYCLILIIESIRNKDIPLRVVIPIMFLWSSLFNIHGLIAFASLAFLGLPLIPWTIARTSQLWANKSGAVGLLALSLAIWLINSQPLLTSYMSMFMLGAVKPIVQTQLQPASTVSEDSSGGNSNPYVREVYQNGFLSNSQAFLNYFYSGTLVLVLIGTAGLIYLFRWHRDKRWWITIYTLSGFSMFMVSQQHLFGVNWLSDRFVRGLYPYVISLAGFGLLVIHKGMTELNPRWGRFVAPAIGLYILTQTYGPWSQAIAQAYTPALPLADYQFYRKVGELVDTDTPIYNIALVSRWGLGVNPRHQVTTLDLDQLCVATTNPPESNKDPSSAFDSRLSATESAAKLRQLAGGSYVIIFDTINHCVSQELFSRQVYDWVIQSPTLRLLVPKSQ